MKSRLQPVHARRTPRSFMACLAVSILAISACGDDDDDATTTAAAPATTAAPAATEAPPASEPAGEVDAYCALAEEMDQREDFPTAEQMTRYIELAPAEIADAANTAASALIPVAGDMVASMAVFAQDDVELAIDEIDAYETANCGIRAEDDEGGLPEGATEEIEADAARVDVVASDYAFKFEEPIAAGRTSFVLTNEGEEAHFLLVSKIKDGVTVEEALAMEDPEAVIEGEWETGLAAPGGDDEEVITFDLEPGTYALLCFISSADGTPHAFLGMQAELIVD